MKNLALIGFCFLICSCDTLWLARSQAILLETPHAENAKCTLTDARGRKWRTRTPKSIAVKDGHSPLHIICKKRGFKTTSILVGEQKEELLTIDGERVSVGIYDGFPQRSPRLIPSAVKETASFILDPIGSISTKFPDNIKVWMEPNKWGSKSEMLAWSYDRSIYNRANFITDYNEKIKEEERQAQLKQKKLERKEKRKDILTKVTNFTKKHLKPKTYVDYTTKTAKAIADNSKIIAKGATDTTRILADGAIDSSVILFNGAEDFALEGTKKTIELPKESVILQKIGDSYIRSDDAKPLNITEADEDNFIVKNPVIIVKDKKPEIETSSDIPSWYKN